MTKGQIEAKISEMAAKFEVEFIGRGPKHIKTIIIEDLIIIRQKGFLSPAEQKLAEDRRGVELVKKARTMLFENAEEYFKKLINQVINIDIVSIHSDVSTKTGEKIILITVSKNLEKEFEK
ncbi:DUF2294 domain-containing protein [Clostridium polyendosporum]|uniref:DUF2294 domain-containing protein n=1 Tax=Clostridium polyendosporum TaxID=69208 RepID=A0A919S0Q1_9CLOT|nr:DUF2294 domain-containing protein [Clostridium polyendosporum]GIM29156.1 DUF2294 domain-containing protein [Clostridium polyendosporum]